MNLMSPDLHFLSRWYISNIYHQTTINSHKTTTFPVRGPRFYTASESIFPTNKDVSPKVNFNLKSRHFLIHGCYTSGFIGVLTGEDSGGFVGVRTGEAAGGFDGALTGEAAGGFVGELTGEDTGGLDGGQNLCRSLGRGLRKDFR